MPLPTVTCPNCRATEALQQDSGGLRPHDADMDALIDPLSCDYTGTSTSTLANAVYLRLMTPLGGWWGNVRLGSRLHELTREKDLPRVHLLARQYAEQALAPLIEDGRARDITVSTVAAQQGHCDLYIRVRDASGQEHHYTYPIKVS